MVCHASRLNTLNFATMHFPIREGTSNQKRLLGKRYLSVARLVVSAMQSVVLQDFVQFMGE